MSLLQRFHMRRKSSATVTVTPAFSSTSTSILSTCCTSTCLKPSAASCSLSSSLSTVASSTLSPCPLSPASSYLSSPPGSPSAPSKQKVVTVEGKKKWVEEPTFREEDKNTTNSTSSLNLSSELDMSYAGCASAIVKSGGYGHSDLHPGEQLLAAAEDGMAIEEKERKKPTKTQTFPIWSSEKEQVQFKIDQHEEVKGKMQTDRPPRPQDKRNNSINSGSSNISSIHTGTTTIPANTTATSTTTTNQRTVVPVRKGGHFRWEESGETGEKKEEEGCKTSICIYNTSNGDIYTINTDGNDTIQGIKVKLFQLINVDIKNMKLCLYGKELQNCKRICENNAANHTDSKLVSGLSSLFLSLHITTTTTCSTTSSLGNSRAKTTSFVEESEQKTGEGQPTTGASFSRINSSRSFSGIIEMNTMVKTASSTRGRIIHRRSEDLSPGGEAARYSRAKSGGGPAAAAQPGRRDGRSSGRNTITNNKRGSVQNSSNLPRYHDICAENTRTGTRPASGENNKVMDNNSSVGSLRGKDWFSSRRKELRDDHDEESDGVLSQPRSPLWFRTPNVEKEYHQRNNSNYNTNPGNTCNSTGEGFSNPSSTGGRQPPITLPTINTIPTDELSAIPYRNLNPIISSSCGVLVSSTVDEWKSSFRTPRTYPPLVGTTGGGSSSSCSSAVSSAIRPDSLAPIRVFSSPPTRHTSLLKHQLCVTTAGGISVEEERRRLIQKNYLDALELNPEAFCKVVMLYIDIKINNVEFKAFVDSGAQMTIMTETAARKAQIDHLIDTRFHGQARGVGAAPIIGRIHMTNISVSGTQRNYSNMSQDGIYPNSQNITSTSKEGKKVDEETLPKKNHYSSSSVLCSTSSEVSLLCSFTIMSDQDVDVIVGLDMLMKHECIIDLARHVLKIGDIVVPFLPEKDLPKRNKK